MTSFTVIVVLELFVWCSGMKIPVKERMEEYMEDNRLIIGGRNATISEFPYVVSLQWKGTFICGGTIISEKFILTAAHCVTQSGGEKFLTVRVGSSYVQKEGFVHNVKRTVKHPKYRSPDYDTAVIELEEPIKFNENASAIEISDREPQQGDIATVTGYGRYNVSSRKNLELPPVLQTVDIEVVSSRMCQLFFWYLTQRMFCTWEEGKGPYMGDSGGPIVLYGKVAGAVSFGSMEPLAKPTVYSKFVNKNIREFIKKETGI